MNAHRTHQEKTLYECCLSSLKQLKEDSLQLTEKEQAFHDLIESIKDPLEWNDAMFEEQTAATLLEKLEASEKAKIQISALCASVRSIKAVAAYPTNTYI